MEQDDFETLLTRAEREAGTEHLYGVRWHEAPLPRRWHRCWAQTTGWYGVTRVERCACGGIRLDGRRWSDRNASRK